jgi:hypothetical protein
MDIRRNGFFGTLTLNGQHLLLGNNMCLHGSLMSLVGESLKTLSAERSRLVDGDMEICLRIRNKPIDASKEGVMLLGKAEELSALMDGIDGDQPHEGESYEDFYHRLLNSDYPQASAEFIAAQWFGREVNPTTTLWLNDPKAVRFRVLNSRDEEFEAALPSEYEALKNYVRVTYPEFVAHLTFRTA